MTYIMIGYLILSSIAYPVTVEFHNQNACKQAINNMIGSGLSFRGDCVAKGMPQ